MISGAEQIVYENKSFHLYEPAMEQALLYMLFKKQCEIGILDKGYPFVKNGIPVNFLIKETDNCHKILVRINGIEGKIVVYDNKSDTP